MMNELKKIQEFQKVLAGYSVSHSAKTALEHIKLVLFVGPSSSGRNTIINELVKSGNYHYVVSDTTRQPRVNNGLLEESGREYWFRTETEVLADLQSGAFLEAAIIHNQQVSGISVRELQAAADEHKIAITEIEVVGADNIYAADPHALFLFVIPPSFDEWMARMSARGGLPQEEITRRLTSAVQEITIGLDRDYYWFVVNDTFMQTAKKVDEIIKQQLVDPEEQAAAKAIAKQLLAETQQHLSTPAKS